MHANSQKDTVRSPGRFTFRHIQKFVADPISARINSVPMPFPRYSLYREIAKDGVSSFT